MGKWENRKIENSKITNIEKTRNQGNQVRAWGLTKGTNIKGIKIKISNADKLIDVRCTNLSVYLYDIAKHFTLHRLKFKLKKKTIKKCMFRYLIANNHNIPIIRFYSHRNNTFSLILPKDIFS